MKAAIAAVVLAAIAIALGVLLTPRQEVAAPAVADIDTVTKPADEPQPERAKTRNGTGQESSADNRLSHNQHSIDSTQNPQTIVISVVGMVRQPGVVHVPGDARVVDAVNAAGGLLPEANPASVNLAAPLSDGQQIIVSDVALPASPAPPPPSTSSGQQSATLGDSAGGKVNINTATEQELDQLPGIGPATAAKIISYREENGPFASLEALEEVPGIGPAKIEALRDVAEAR